MNEEFAKDFDKLVADMKIKIASVDTTLDAVQLRTLLFRDMGSFKAAIDIIPHAIKSEDFDLVQKLHEDLQKTWNTAITNLLQLECISHKS